MNPTKLISYAFGVIVFLILVSSFTLSYSNLQESAIDAGIEPLLAPMWPLCLDLFLAGSSLYILRSNLLTEDSRPGWVVLIIFTAVSTAFNVIHSPENITAQSTHAVPPIALCISLELLMMILKSDLSREEKPRVEVKEPSIEVIEPLNEVQLYFIQHPEASINQARKDLQMSWKRVKEEKERVDPSTLRTETSTP